jgi:Protein of unknown function (DUF3631)
MPAKNTQKKVASEFTRTREFIGRYSSIESEELDLIAVWAMGTWCFSPACQWPATFPYLYITGGAGSGKSVLGNDALGSVCRRHTVATGATGPTLFRMLGRYDEETGAIENYAPTLMLDEIDATFSGQKDEPLRQGLNVGYKRSGSTIPRSAGKTTIDFPVYGPKVMMGIENGHLPETVLTRSIRIDLHKKTETQLREAGIQEFYSWDVEDEAAELQEQLAAWAKRESMVLRDYRPNAPAGLSARQWEIGRTLVQLAHAIGNEDRIVKSLIAVLNRRPQRPDAKVALYRAIVDVFEAMPAEHADRITSRQILAKLKEEGIRVPGESLKGLANVLSEDGVHSADPIRLRPGHPGIPEEAIRETADPSKARFVQRGYFRHWFDEAIVRYLEDDE